MKRYNQLDIALWALNNEKESPAMQKFIYMPVPEEWAPAMYAKLGELADQHGSAAVTNGDTPVEAEQPKPALDEPLVKRMYDDSYEAHKEFLRFLAEHPGEWFYTSELGKELKKDRGARAIAGMLGAFGRRAKHRYAGLKPWHSKWDRSVGEARHTMDPEIAEIIRRIA